MKKLIALPTWLLVKLVLFNGSIKFSLDDWYKGRTELCQIFDWVFLFWGVIFIFAIPYFILK